jgi:uncharacterized RDD family membrane protein YckC
MDQPQSQSDPRSSRSYFDPEALDTSEQQFSASLEARVERPRFVVDTQQEATASPESLTELESKSDCMDACKSSSVVEEPILRQSSQLMRDAGPPCDEHDPAAHDWRNQVSAKVNIYKARRPQKDRYPSLRLPFEPESRNPKTPSFAASLASELDQPAIIEEPVPKPYRPIILESTARVLEFPRVAAPSRSDELAESVFDRPRIVEAPELVPPPPAMGGILIEPAHQPEPERRAGIDFPLQSASIARRLMAAMLDGLVIAVSLVAFGYIFLRINSNIPPVRSVAEIIAALLAILWPTYQYSFLVHTGTTPGLRLMRLQVSRFDGTLASRNLRRWRVLASCLSGASLALGYAWCLLDEDQLCWHDRITKTHLARR